ncbi:MAG TPA: hypothetical protein VFI29_11200 [Hanamia sp.]|nr:hypothetical protein [Hanamia sp.]
MKNCLKLILIPLLALIFSEPVESQSTPPEKVIGKTIGFGPGGGFLKEKQFIFGHNNGVEVPSTVHSNFTAYDNRVRKILNVILSAPSLNPPTGFDAAVQLEDYHTSSNEMYHGVMNIWMFMYEKDWDSHQIERSSETGYIINIFLNDPTILMGKKIFFSDTIHYRQVTNDGYIKAENVDGNEVDMVLTGNEHLFVPYSAGQFLKFQQNFFEKKIQEANEDLNDDQSNVTSTQNPSGSHSAAIKEFEDKIHEDSLDLLESKKDLKDAEGIGKTMAEQQVQGYENEIASLKKAMAQFNGRQQKNFENEMSNSYNEVVSKDKKTLQDYRDRIKEIREQYNNMPAENRQQQAFVINSLDNNVINDDGIIESLKLVPAGTENATPLFTYNPGYFDHKQPSNIQLLISTYNANKIVQGDYRSEKEIKLVHELNYKALHDLME